MNRHTFIYLFISFTMVSLGFGFPPLAAAETSNVPIGVTETFTPTPANTAEATNTPTPANTAEATNTPTPANTAEATNTPTPANTAEATNTPTPANTAEATNTPAPTEMSGPTNTLVPTPGNTPTAPAVVGLPNTGGAAPQGGASPWILVLVAAVIGSLGALAFGLSIQAHRPTQR